MPSRSMVSGAARAGAAETLSTIGGALLLILALLLALLSVVDVFGRIGAGRPLLGAESLQLVTTYFGLGFAAASLLALPAALAAPFVRTGGPPLLSHSALALVPGCAAALAVLVIAIAAVIVSSGAGADVALTLVVRRLYATFTDFVFLFIPLTLVFAAALGGGRTPEATAAAAAPVVLAGLAGSFGGLSIMGLLLSVLLPLLAAAVAIAVLYAVAPARTATPWLAGIALSCGMAILVATGALTPTEAMGLVALFGVPITLLVRIFALRHPTGPMLRQMGTETAAIVVVMAASTMAGAAFTLAGIGLGAELRVTPLVLLGGGAAFLALSYALTPTLALGLAIPLAFPLLSTASIDQTLAAAIMILLGLAAMMLRAARRDPMAPAHCLPPAAAFGVAVVFAGLAVVVAFVPSIALGPVRALLQ